MKDLIIRLDPYSTGILDRLKETVNRLHEITCLDPYSTGILDRLIINV